MQGLSTIGRSAAGKQPRRSRSVLLFVLLSCFGCAGSKPASESRSATATSANSPNAPLLTVGSSAGAAASRTTTSSSGASPASPTSAAAVSGSAGSASPATPGATGAATPPPASGCAEDALDQQGCACNKIGATRACYSADPITRNVGECKDGIQTCVADPASSSAEFMMQVWGPCMEQVVPTECTEQLDARCVGKVGCADEQCADKLGCPKDAGVPDAGNKRCHTVRGFGFGTGFFPDGGMWCER